MARYARRPPVGACAPPSSPRTPPKVSVAWLLRQCAIQVSRRCATIPRALHALPIPRAILLQSTAFARMASARIKRDSASTRAFQASPTRATIPKGLLAQPVLIATERRVIACATSTIVPTRTVMVAGHSVPQVLTRPASTQEVLPVLRDLIASMHLVIAHATGLHERPLRARQS